MYIRVRTLLYTIVLRPIMVAMNMAALALVVVLGLFCSLEAVALPKFRDAGKNSVREFPAGVRSNPLELILDHVKKESIGAKQGIKSACPCYTTQLWGGTKGSAFSDLPTDQPCIGDITKIRIRHGDAIDAIQITYKLYNGKTLTAPKHGWDGGEPEEIVLEEGEKIIGVYGFNDSFVRTGDPYIHNIVRQLTFVSLKKTNLPAIYGPYGLVQTKNQVNDGLGHTFVIMGYIDSIFGRSGEYIDAIGFNYEPWDCLDV